MARYICIEKSVRSVSNSSELNSARGFGRAIRCLGLIVALGVAGVVLACTGGEPTPELDQEIVIGVIAPVASSFFRSGPPTVKGAELAAMEINATGGILVGSRRRKIRLIIEDTEDQPETAVSKAFKLIGTDRAAALIGLPISNSALAVAKVAEEQRVPMISTTSSHPETTQGKSFVFRTIFTDSFQGRIMAELAFRDLRARRAAVLSDPGSAYSRGFAQVFRQVFEREGGKTVAEESFTADDSDTSDQLLRIQRSAADVVVVPVYEELLTSLIPQARKIGITVPVLGGDSWSGLTAAERGGWNPSYFSDVWAPDAPSSGARRFIDSYRRDYGEPATSYAALAYDAVFMLAAAIERQGDAAPESIRAGLLSIEDFAGVTGAIRYQDSGDPMRTAVIMRLADDGSAHFHQRFEP